MADSDLIDITARIVIAHLEHNAVPSSAIPSFIEDVHQSVISMTDSHAGAVRPEPAISIKKSAQPDHIVCLECGGKQKVLKTHLMMAHNMTADEYRARWNLPAHYKMTAADYGKMRQAIAKKHGLGKRK
ncbi:MucR family transcriptional regulator [Sphingomonas crocodyli]|uniref:MucR family transcriptional regulator n=1 Tax=Sphingomonas crocodyli TaxID=1979270 RepID=A0A437LYR2_9SPHN|nr:MucR family transcriptional regulator [Sphingomonas crocodyli]RVT90522.1 MucR family transcriptional regulator [Sphingomonas crocodyli]